MCSVPKTVQYSDDAYAALAALKRPAESFSDLALRLARERKDPTAMFRLSGLRPGFDPDSLRERSRKIDVARLKERGLLK